MKREMGPWVLLTHATRYNYSFGRHSLFQKTMLNRYTNVLKFFWKEPNDDDPTLLLSNIGINSD